MTVRYLRQCQVCKSKQEDKQPIDHERLSQSYEKTMCYNCFAIGSLDVGHWQIDKASLKRRKTDKTEE